MYNHSIMFMYDNNIITISYHVYNPILSSQQRRDEHLPAAGAAAEALRRAEARCETGQQPGES